MRNIYHNNRAHFNRCVYYNRDERDSVGDLTKWILTQKPQGVFYAKEVSQKTNQANQLGGVLMFDKYNITLETGDDVNDIKRGSVVNYLNHAWLVENIQLAIQQKETEFGKDQYITYITLTKGA